jgi:hypothetical protein
VMTFTDISSRQRYDDGREQGLRHVQLLRFVDELLEEMGDSVPWKKEVNARVLSHGHPTYSRVHDIAKRDVGKIVSRIPGAEFVGPLDRTVLDSFCDSEPGDWKRARPTSREESEQYRIELAEIAQSWGADTVSPSHQTCLQMWEPYASEQCQVRHPMSLLAEALGVGHADRYLAASRLGDTQAIVNETRPLWSAWGMSEEAAYTTAQAMFDPALQRVDICGCGKGPNDRCGHFEDDVISLDVLKGVAQ